MASFKFSLLSQPVSLSHELLVAFVPLLSLPPAMQAVHYPESEFCIAASRAETLQTQAQQSGVSFAGHPLPQHLSGSHGSQGFSSSLSEMGLPPMANLLPSPDFRLQLFKVTHAFCMPFAAFAACMRQDQLF